MDGSATTIRTTRLNFKSLEGVLEAVMRENCVDAEVKNPFCMHAASNQHLFLNEKTRHILMQ